MSNCVGCSCCLTPSPETAYIRSQLAEALKLCDQYQSEVKDWMKLAVDERAKLYSARAMLRDADEQLAQARMSDTSELSHLISVANAGLDALCTIGEKYRDQVEEGGDGCQTVSFGTVAGSTTRHRIRLKGQS